MPVRKLSALLALIALSTTAAAQEPGKVWFDTTCKVRLESDGSGAFKISTVSASYTNTCRIADWPTSSPTATMLCADKTEPTMELEGEAVIFEGLKLLNDDTRAIALYPRGSAMTSCR